MTRTNAAARAVFPALAAVTALLVLAVLIPQPLVGQCAECMYTGGSEFGWGQPGGGLDCVDLPEGMTDCQIGPGWCETSGSTCQALMFLDFSEDGAASWETVSDGESRYTAGDEQADSTCDGVLLRGRVPDDAPDRAEVVLSLAL